MTPQAIHRRPMRINRLHAGPDMPRLSPAIPYRVPRQGANPTTIKAELQHLVVHRCAQAAEQDVGKHKYGRDHRGSKKLHPKITCRISAIAYSPTPDTSTVSTANESALKTRVGSPKRSFRNSGTLRTLLR